MAVAVEIGGGQARDEGGRRIVGDWPGLAKKDRYEGRDLRTTTDLRGLLKGVLGEHLHVATRALDQDVFPGSDAVRPVAVA